MERDRRHGTFAVRRREILRGLALVTALAVGLEGSGSASAGGQTVSEIGSISADLFTPLPYPDDFPRRPSLMYQAQEGLKEIPDDNSPGEKVIVVFPPSPTPELATLTPKPEQTASLNWKLDPEISFYGPDGFYGNWTACGKKLTRNLEGVASRTLPCGTLVTFNWEGTTRTFPVVDRGPYVEGRIFDLTGGACMAFKTKQYPQGHCFTGPIKYRIEDRSQQQPNRFRSRL